MKVGLRKPSIKKSIKARTTGKLERSIKRKVNPLYGKKGMGYINDPKKAVYNKVYNKTTVGVGDIARLMNTPGKSSNVTTPDIRYSSTTYKFFGILATVFAILFLLIGIISFFVGGFLFIIPSILLFIAGRSCSKLSKIKKEVED